MVNRKLKWTTTVAVLALTGTCGIAMLYAQQPGFKRTALQTQDLSVPGRQGVAAIAEFAPGATVGKHTHPGEEMGYVLEGTLQLEIDGKPPVALKAGDAFFVTAGTVHNATNTSKGTAKVLATYFVEKGKPVASPVK